MEKLTNGALVTPTHVVQRNMQADGTLQIAGRWLMGA